MNRSYWQKISGCLTQTSRVLRELQNREIIDQQFVERIVSKKKRFTKNIKLCVYLRKIGEKNQKYFASLFFLFFLKAVREKPCERDD